MGEAVLAFLTAVLTAMPELITDVEKLVASFKQTQSGGDPGTTPLAPQFARDSADADAALHTPVK